MDFVTTNVHPKNAVALDLSDEGLKEIIESTSADIESIKKHLVVVLFNDQKQSEIEALVQSYQSLIIRLLNDLFGYQLHYRESNSNLNILYDSVCDLLANVLTYIETYFSRYFDVDEEIPQ